MTTVDPKTLSPHPLNRAMPRIRPGMPEWQALFDDVRERGIQEPIRVVGNRVVDGETRRQVAIAIGLDQVPVVEVPEDQAIATIVEHLVLQKHLTRGQRAYICYPVAKPLADESKARRIANLKKGSVSRYPTESDSGNIGVFADFCKRVGFSQDLYEQAQTLHRLFSGDPETMRGRGLADADPEALRAEWEPKILDMVAPVGLGAALAGIAGAQATEGRPKSPNGPVQLQLFQQGVQAFDRVARDWTKHRAHARAEFVGAWRRVAAGWAPEMRRELADALLDGIA